MTLQQEMEVIIEQNPFISKTDIVYTLLLERILTGAFEGGQKINQEEISAQLHISRSPVRDALNRLSTEGYLAKEGASGYYIYRLKMEDYLTINEFRTMIEGFAVELCVSRIYNRELEQLQKNLEDTAKAVEENDVEAFSQLDSEFHMLLVCAAHNPMIQKTYEENAQKFQLFRFLTLSEDVMATALRWHRKVYQAIEAGDAQAAGEAARMHRENTISATREICKKRNE